MVTVLVAKLHRSVVPEGGSKLGGNISILIGIVSNLRSIYLS